MIFLDIEDFKDIHKGRRCFVVGNGPSLNNTPLHLLQDEITIGCNRIYLHKTFTPRYYTLEDRKVAFQIRRDIINFKGPRYKFIPLDIDIKSENTVPIRFRRNSQEPFRFVDKSHSTFYWGGTVTYLMIQLAYYMGCNPIYLVGIDHNYKNQEGGIYKDGDFDHFHPDYFKNVSCNPPHKERMERAYRYVKEYSKTLGFEIYNATVGGELEVFERIEFSSLFKDED